MPHELFLRKHTKGNKGGKKMVRDPYEDFGQVYDKEFEERMKRKKAKEREKRIKENKAKI